VLPGEIDGRRFLRAMARFGWGVSKTKGSHRILKREGSSRILIVAFHDTLSRNSVRRALREAGIDEDTFQDSL
jgi:predicted RNA binding protein YcfA (HicA-like mRNA interferase family)